VEKMKELKTKAGELSDSVTEYVHTYYKLSILKAADKATTVVSSLLSSVAVFFLGIFVLLFSGIALGIWLGELVHSVALGYLLVAGIYLLIIIILVLMRKKIVFPMIRNLIINKIYE
jgi:hypothetical protein